MVNHVDSPCKACGKNCVLTGASGKKLIGCSAWRDWFREAWERIRKMYGVKEAQS